MRGGLPLVLMFLLAACASVSPVRTLVPPPTEATEVHDSTTSSVPEVMAPADIPLLASFLAAVDDATRGTGQEGVALEDPEGVIGTAVLFCDLLGQGLTVEEVMTAYVGAVSDRDPMQVVTTDELRLGGVILGAGVEIICPEYRDRLDL